MDTLRVHLFGRLSIQRDGSKVFESLPPKAQELLVYLLLYRQRWHARERLAAQLWPEAGPSEARARLRRLMWRLQDCLGEDAAAARLLKVEGDWLAININAGLWLDVAVVEDAYSRLGTAPDAGFTAELVAELEAATCLISGDLLDNWYQEWCIVERERLRIIQISVLSSLVNHYVASGRIERGVATASQLLQIDRAHEGAHRQLMRLRYMAGDRTGALRQFEICRQVLDEEFRVTPERLTIALVDEIRCEQLSVSDQSSSKRRSKLARSRVSSSNIHSQLDRLQELVVESQDRVSQELHALHSTIQSYSGDTRQSEYEER